MDDEFEKRVSLEAKKAADAQRKPKKKTISQLPESLASVNWSHDRPRPLVTEFWDPETREELAKYIDWHHRHPHCATPRLLPNGGEGQGRMTEDPENPGKKYSSNGVKIHPIPAEFRKTALGNDCNIDEVTSVALRTEYDELQYYLASHEDPWYIMSVKDHLEQSHCDGSHTTVKSKPLPTHNNRLLLNSNASALSSSISVLSDSSMSVTRFDGDAAWKAFSFEDYAGGAPELNSEHTRAMNELALQDKSVMNAHKKTPKVSPWATEYKFSKFTANGTALNEFKAKERNERVAAAMDMHRQDEALPRRVKSSSRGGQVSTSSSKSRKSSTKSGLNEGSKKSTKSSRSRKSDAQVHPESAAEAALAREEVMRTKLGGQKALEKQGKEWMAFAKVVARKSKMQKNALNTSMDLCEACEKLRVVKAATLLFTGQGSANMLTPDDEPLFLHTFQRAVQMDVASNSLLAEDVVNESPDRQKLRKLLELLVKFEADVNTVEGRERIAAIHCAARADDAKMVTWLLEHAKADASLFTDPEDMDTSVTALMTAAKYGNVHVLAALAAAGVDINEQNPAGMTALHFAGKFGQTRAAMFLLRIGCDKRLQNREHKTASALAQESFFAATSNAIASFAIAEYKAGPQLQYIVDEELKKRDKKPMSKLKSLGFLGRQLSESLTHLKDWVVRSAVKSWKWLMKMLTKYGILQPADDDNEDEEEGLDSGDALDRKLQALSQKIHAHDENDDMDDDGEVNDQEGPIAIFGEDDVLPFDDSIA